MPGSAWISSGERPGPEGRLGDRALAVAEHVMDSDVAAAAGNVFQGTVGDHERGVAQASFERLEGYLPRPADKRADAGFEID